jgi:hypothetical protein
MGYELADWFIVIAVAAILFTLIVLGMGPDQE